MTEWAGTPDRECGDHRATANGRAWCFSCSTWCYPEIPCPGCETPALRALLDDYRSALALAYGWISKAADPDAATRAGSDCSRWLTAEIKSWRTPEDVDR